MLCGSGLGALPLNARADAATPPVPQLVSRNSDGQVGDNWSAAPAISADGRYVAFVSIATNLVVGDDNGAPDVFVRDRTTGTTERVIENAVLGPLEHPSISADGRYIASTSCLPGATSDEQCGAFVHDRLLGSTERVPTDGAIPVSPSLSLDGRLVAYASCESPVTCDLAIRDRQTGESRSLGVTNLADFSRPLVSGDGKFMAQLECEPGGGLPQCSLAVTDTETASTERIDAPGESFFIFFNTGFFGLGGPSISTDGRFITATTCTPVVPPGAPTPLSCSVVLVDRAENSVTNVTAGFSELDGFDFSFAGSISADGRTLAFSSFAPAADGGGEIVPLPGRFVYDTATGSRTRLTGPTSVAEVLADPDRFFFDFDDIIGGTPFTLPVISADGCNVAYVSTSPLLDPGDTNSAPDVFVIELERCRAKVITRPAEQLFGARASSGYASDPVNTATGNFIHEASDLTFPAPGLMLSRTYNSLDTSSRSLGLGWAASHEARVDEAPSGVVTFTDFDGRQVPFEPDGSGGYVRPEELFADLVKLDDGTFELVYFAGETWAFDTAGRLVAKRFWDGQSVAYTRNPSGNVTRAASTTGYAMTFTYTGDRITRAEADDGRAVTYAYDPAGNLVSVTDPVGAVTEYDLDAAGRITKIIDPDGRLVIENTYDTQGRVSHQRTGSGGGAAFAYNDATGVTTLTDDTTGATLAYAHDADGHLTSVTDPYGETLTKTYDAFGNLASVTDRRSAATSQTFDAHGNLVSRTGPGGVTETYLYDSSDRLISQTDALSNVTLYGYEGNERVPSEVTDPRGGVARLNVVGGLVSSYTDADGVVTTFAYDARRLLTSTTDELGNTTRFTYDPAGRQTSVKTPLGHETTTTYDASGRVTETTDPLGAVTRTLYDTAGNVTESIDPTGASTRSSYNAAGLLASSTDANGAVTTYVYDAHGNLIETHLPSGAVETSTYDPLGRLLTATDAVGGVTTFAYDADGNEVSVTDPLGAVTSREIDLRGRLVAETDALGRVTRTDYDDLDRVISTTDPTGAVTRTVYDASGNVAEIIDAVGARTLSRYSPAGRLAETVDPREAATTNAYDTAGRLVTMTDPLGGVSRTAYDNDGRVVSETSAAGLVTRFGYDAAGQRTSVTSPRGHITRTVYSPRGEVTREIAPTGATKHFVFDGAGNLTTATDPNGGVTRYAYDAVGNRVTMTDAKGAVTAFAYDPARRRTAVTDPLGRTTTFAYDGAGRITSTMDPSGRSTAITYDAAGQVTQRTYGDSSIETFAYDAAGRRTQMIDATGTTRFAYDPVGRLTATTHPDGAVVAATYDAGGNRTSLTYPDATVAAFNYDAASRLVSLTHSVAGAATYGLDADGRLVAESLPDGSSRAFRYNGDLLDRFTQTRGSNRTVTTLARDANDRIVSETINGATRRYSYDAAGQLTRVSGSDDDDNAAYSYDAVGNRVRETLGDDDAASYSYDAASQLVQRRGDEGTTRFTFDPAGRLTSEADGDRSTTRSYDARGLLAQRVVIGGSARVTTDYSHDADGTLTRLGITTTGSNSGDDDDDDDDGDDGDGGGDSGSQPTTARYVLRWDGGGMGDVLTLGRDGSDTDLIYGYGRALAASGGAGIVFSYDAHGSALRTPASQSLVAARAYDAFGNPSTDLGQDPLFGYRSELHVGADIHLRARTYDPAIGRFTTVDPFEDRDGEVRSAAGYQYARNDPLNTGDASGLTPARDSGLRSASNIAGLRTTSNFWSGVAEAASTTPGGGPPRPTTTPGTTTSTSGGTVNPAGASTTGSAAAAVAVIRMFLYSIMKGCTWNNNVRNIHDFLLGRNCFPWAYWYYANSSQLKSNFRYAPVLKRNTDAGRRMMVPYSGGKVCSTPLPVGLGDTGPSYNFRNACRTHDYAYDILRWCARDGFGSCSNTWGVAQYWATNRVKFERTEADLGFYDDMFWHCERRPDRNSACHTMAKRYYVGVARWSRQQGYGIP